MTDHHANAVAALRKSEERFRSIFQHHAAVKLLIDPETGDIVQANDAAAQFYGWSCTELMTMRIQDINILTPEEVKTAMAEARSLRRTYFEFRHRLANGSVRDVEVYSSRVEVDGKELLHSIVHDVTSRKQAEERIQHAQKMEAIGTLAGGIAHDFNNILFSIIGHAELLLEDTPTDSPDRKSLEQIHIGATRAKKLVRQILAFSRQEKNELAQIKIQPIVKEALKLIRSTIPATIAIKQELLSDCGPVEADPVQIHQIIMNLATNAYHAMAETGGTLTVSLKEIQVETTDPVSPDLQPGTYLCLSVADTGTGMDKVTVEKIFDPFFTTKKKGKGTGMGLSVVHGIVTAMNGAIQVQTEPGRGTIFNLFLPVVETGAADDAPLIKESLVGGTEHILLVDDEKPVLAIEKRLLSRLGYQVTSCNGSIEALEMFTADPDRFDMVISDIAMPKMSGDKLADELLKIRPEIPILLCTGFSETMTDEKMAAAGVKGLLIKPFVITDLDKKLRDIFGQRNCL